MFKKIWQTCLIWLFVVIAYISLAASMPVHVAIVQDTQSAFASQNMTGIVGVNDWVGAFPLYVWFIPGLVGVVLTVVRLKFD